jgi:hypothetical protein
MTGVVLPGVAPDRPLPGSFGDPINNLFVFPGTGPASIPSNSPIPPLRRRQPVEREVCVAPDTGPYESCIPQVCITSTDRGEVKTPKPPPPSSIYPLSRCAASTGSTPKPPTL